jgi:hypothetical protein
LPSKLSSYVLRAYTADTQVLIREGAELSHKLFYPLVHSIHSLINPDYDQPMHGAYDASGSDLSERRYSDRPVGKVEETVERLRQAGDRRLV